MRIAIIGGLGFIGRELTKAASESGFETDVYDVVEYEKQNQDDFEYYKIDLNGNVPETLRSADAMVILAAKRSYDGFCFHDYEENVRIAECCFDFAKEAGISNIVFASSKAVYSDQESIPWNEEQSTSPLSLYGASKAAVEQLGLLYNKKGMAIKSLRFAQVIGMGERKGYLLNTLIDNAVSKRKQVIFGDGSQSRQYIYIKDVCSAILAALQKPDIRGIFNIGMPGRISNLELAEAVNDVFGNTGNLEFDHNQKMDTYCDEMDVRKAECILGFKTRYDLKGLFKDLAGLEIN